LPVFVVFLQTILFPQEWILHPSTNSQCSISSTDYVCSCVHGYYGNDCEKVNICELRNPCKWGKCIHLDNNLFFTSINKFTMFAISFPLTLAAVTMIGQFMANPIKITRIIRTWVIVLTLFTNISIF
jgi:hypothetical protein